MKVLYVTAECWPFAKTGGLGDVAYALPKALKREGCRIVLWTCRCGRELEQAVQWCEEFGLEFDKVNRNTDEILEKYGSDSRKIYADVYIDDKACFPWEVMAYKKEE